MPTLVAIARIRLLAFSSGGWWSWTSCAVPHINKSYTLHLVKIALDSRESDFSWFLRKVISMEGFFFWRVSSLFT